MTVDIRKYYFYIELRQFTGSIELNAYDTIDMLLKIPVKKFLTSLEATIYKQLLVTRLRNKGFIIKEDSRNFTILEADESYYLHYFNNIRGPKPDLGQTPDKDDL